MCVCARTVIASNFLYIQLSEDRASRARGNDFGANCSGWLSSLVYLGNDGREVSNQCIVQMNS